MHMQENFNQTEATHEAPELQGVSRGDILRRVFCYALGLFILALGVSFSIKSNLGVSPVSSMPYVFSQILGWDMGLVTAVLFSLYVGLQALLLRRQFQLKSLLQILVGMVFGSFVSLTNHIVAFESPQAYLLQLLLMCVGIFFVALGLLFILAADIVPQPPEGLMLAIEIKTGWQFSKIKIGFDCAVVAIAAVASLVFLGGLYGVREGTVLAALSVGAVLGLLRRLFGGAVERMLHKVPGRKLK